MKISQIFYRFGKLYEEFPQGADAFFCRSRALSAYLKEKGISAKLFYIPIGVNTKEFYPQPKAAKNDKFIFLSTGALSYRKGTHHLLDAFNLFSKKNGGTSELWLAGDSRPAILRELKERARGNPDVRWLGVIPPVSIAKLYQQCDVCVSPALVSEWAPIQPNASEAMACGRPLIIGNFFESRILEQHTVALTFQTGDSDDLFKKMERLFLDKDLRETLSRNAPPYIEKNFSWEVLAEKCIQYYRQL